MEPVNKKIKVANATTGDEDGPASFLVPIEIRTIPTKTYDGGTPRSQKASEEGAEDDEPQTPNGRMYYSNEANRLSHLLFRCDDKGSESEPTERKTRLSFEVHPDLLYHNFLNAAAAAAVAQQEDAATSE
mmetsp:Transcript_21786/g.32992  ORF Transcript_21786/g.32992 Transcript_21786/m.32992 type:complete len:130 (-) Transcript_21786:1468-1857(-)|eukprot:scaffold35685_cov155-Skeletonema_dohrnii-CCMP3373.AAC.3